MDGFLSLSRSQEAKLREEWLQESGAAFDQMFAKDRQAQLVTLTQREDLALALGKELARWLLERHAQADPQVRPSAQEVPRCPRCKETAERVTKRRGSLPERELTTRAGAVALRREKWRCRPCRLVFFSAGPPARSGHRGIQPALDPKGGASGSQGIVSGGE